jgi:hypothetical protein
VLFGGASFDHHKIFHIPRIVNFKAHFQAEAALYRVIVGTVTTRRASLWGP